MLMMMRVMKMNRVLMMKMRAKMNKLIRAITIHLKDHPQKVRENQMNKVNSLTVNNPNS